MKFSAISTFALAAVSVVASPVAQAEKPKLVQKVVARGDIDLGSVVGDVESLLGSIVKDVESIASSAGIDIATILSDAGISLLVKRDDVTGEVKRSVNLDQRDLNSVIGDVESLIGNVLSSLVKLAETAGLSFIEEVLSLGL